MRTGLCPRSLPCSLRRRPFPPSLTALHRHCETSSRSRRRCWGRGALLVENNELNKWGDTDGREGDTDEGEDEFDYIFASDTAKIVARVLTARAVQKVLLQLNETDIYSGRWLTDYCSSNPPMQGDKFVLKLMKERPVAVTDNINQKVHNISPTQLGHRIMLSRAALAAGMKKFDFPAYIARTNTEVLRTHLESSSYTSGSYNKADQGRRKRR